MYFLSPLIFSNSSTLILDSSNPYDCQINLISENNNNESIIEIKINTTEPNNKNNSNDSNNSGDNKINTIMLIIIILKLSYLQG